MSVILYFSPHQDDELIVFGIDISRMTDITSIDCHVYLCTDGAASCVHRTLNNGAENCGLHSGRHCYPLSTKEFTAARDQEFRLSCQRLGVSGENIHISPWRTPDQHLTLRDAEKIILDALNRFENPAEISVRTISPWFGIRKQQDDHRNLGLAAMKLFRDGKFGELVLIAESTMDADCRTCFPEISYTELIPSETDYQKICSAADAYKIWDPERGFYAIGYHSVMNEFESLLANPSSYIHYPTKNDYNALGI